MNNSIFEQKIAEAGSSEEFIKQVDEWFHSDVLKESFDMKESLNDPVIEDGDQRDWNSHGRYDQNTDPRILRMGADRRQFLNRNREMARWQPNAKRALQLLSMYTFGRGFDGGIKPIYAGEKLTEAEKKTVAECKHAWSVFLRANSKWWSPREMGQRCWRDGESFTVIKETTDVGELRFIDPEEIDDPGGSTIDSEGRYSRHGVITSRGDIAKPLGYFRVDPLTGQVQSELKADQVWHSKIDVDSNEPRGFPRIAPVVNTCRRIELFIYTEALIRQMQASVVMTREVQGGQSRMTNHLNNIRTGTTRYSDQETLNREMLRPGSIINHTPGVKIKFEQPDTNFADASPLAKFLMGQIAAASGFPLYMITGDSSESNFASALVAESPVVYMLQQEHDFFRDQLWPIFMWVIDQAIEKGAIKKRAGKKAFWDTFEPEFAWPNLVPRDRIKEAQADNILLMGKVISIPEACRRHNVDPEKMSTEIKATSEQEHLQSPLDAMNQDQSQKGENAQANQGDGQNQGPSDGTGHSDSQK